MGLGIGISGPNGSEPCDDANVVNSDGTYDVDVAAGGTLTLPNINNVDSDGSTVVTPAQTPFVATACSGGSVGATLMKTGQTISYGTGDDGDIEAGRATDFLTLASNNPFGNLSRFTYIDGTQTYTNKIFIDWSTYDGTTVLGYGDSPFGALIWDDCIDEALATSIGSFTSGWRLPNTNEAWNIINMSVTTNQPFSYSPFSNSVFLKNQYNFWTSTTTSYSSGSAYWISGFRYRVISYSNKSNAKNYFPVRTFTVSGTTLT